MHIQPRIYFVADKAPLLTGTEVKNICTVIEGDTDTITFLKCGAYLPVAATFSVALTDYEVGCIYPYQRCVINNIEEPITYFDKTVKKKYTCVVVKIQNPFIRIYETPWMQPKREVALIQKEPLALHLFLFEHTYIADSANGHEFIPTFKFFEGVVGHYEGLLFFKYRLRSVIDDETVGEDDFNKCGAYDVN